MQIKKKITDFLEVEDGNIGRKAMMLTGAVLSTSLLVESLLADCNDPGCHFDGHKDGAWIFTHCDGHLDCPIPE